jgi:ribA/ribD-fused uncharacterized protein
MASVCFETHAAVYFYGVREKRFGFLSNFYPCRFQDAQGTTFKSSEQCFMKQKQELFDPENERLALAILKAKTPSEAKKLGRQVRNYDDDLWAASRLGAMVASLKLKFTSDDELKQKLLATGEKILYEASHRDAIWGIGLSVGKVQEMFRETPAFWEAGDVPEDIRNQCYGQNLLGQALMETRTWLQELEQQVEYKKSDS